MSTVLEKAVLLDETGQLIVDKLDDIKEVIGNSGEYIPLAIRVTTPPTKVLYYSGESLDLSGMIVSLVGSNGSLIDVTSACTFSPTDGATLSTSDTSVAITYHYAPDNVDFTTTQNITVGEVVPVSIAVTTPPTKTEYVVGDTLDLTGMVVTATYNDSSTADVTSSCVFLPTNGATLDSTSINSVSITYIHDASTFSTTQEIEVAGAIYGAEWDGTSTSAWTRTDAAAAFTDPSPAVNNGTGSSPFDDILPWSGMKIVEDDNVGSLVEIPKYYYKWTRDGAKMKLQISESQFEGSHISPAHADRGDGAGERNVVYVGRYHCAQGTYKSTTGSTPLTNQYKYAFRTGIHNLGSSIWQYDFAMFWTIRMLYLVEYADWNSQAKIGYGSGNNSTADKNGKTDAMRYHTGTNVLQRTYYGYTQYRYIEGLWDNCLDWCDGIYFTYTDSSRNIYCIKNPADFSDNSNGTFVGTKSADGGVVTAWTNPSVAGFEYALFPASAITDNSYATYNCDYHNPASSEVLRTGGSYSNNLGNGLFSMICEGSSSKNALTGGRLMKLP